MTHEPTDGGATPDEAELNEEIAEVDARDPDAAEEIAELIEEADADGSGDVAPPPVDPDADA